MLRRAGCRSCHSDDAGLFKLLSGVALDPGGGGRGVPVKLRTIQRFQLEMIIHDEMMESRKSIPQLVWRFNETGISNSGQYWFQPLMLHDGDPQR